MNLINRQKLLNYLFIKKYCVFNLLISIISAFVFVLGNTKFLATLLVLSLIINFLICIRQYNKYFLLLLFVSLFFLFLCGQIILDFLSGNEILMIFQKDTKNFIIFSLILSLSILCFSFHALFNQKKFDPFTIQITRKKIYFENIFIFLFCISSIFVIIKYLEIGIHLFNYGYLSLYTNFKSNLPTFVDQAANLYKLSFFGFLSLFPNKRKMLLLSILFVFISMITLLAGSRGTLMINLVVLVAYYFIRDSLKIDDDPIITKRVLIAILLLVPICMVLLNIFNNIRYGDNILKINVFKSIYDFIYNMGGSCKFIGYTFENKELLHQGLYSLWPITNLINPTKYASNTIEIATLTNNLQFTISYIVYGSRYLLGEGTGGSYIAEVFVDFGYLGIILVNIFYGLYLSKLVDLFKKSYFIGSISLLSLTALFWAPRDSALSFISLPFESKNILLFFLIFVIYKYWDIIISNLKKIIKKF